MEDLVSLTKHVAYLEREVRRIPHTIDGIEERTDTHLQGIEQTLKDFRESTDKRFDNIDKRLDAAFADIAANFVEIRNTLATLIAREK